ncbi:MAG: AAA family ATPase [Gammaproteobacteria bacterium]|nr:AAA family ATPase [Gammaproteobacteria bacterium]
MITVVGSLKGGSGKSTVTFNLAVWLAMAEADLLVIDLDPQATLRDVSEVRQDENISPPVKIHSKSALKRDYLEEFDEVLIDVGTADLETMKRAISMADRILIPVPPSQADIWSTQRFLRLINSLETEDELDVCGFINRADTHHAVRESDEAAAALVSLPGIRYLKCRLAQRTLFRRSFSEGMAVFEMKGKSKGKREFNALCALLYPDLVG